MSARRERLRIGEEMSVAAYGSDPPRLLRVLRVEDIARRSEG